MASRFVGVINQSKNLKPAPVSKAVAAVQLQVSEQFGPIWNVPATISVFQTLDDLPPGYWPVVIRDEIGIDQPGVHVTESGEKPFALVLFTGAHWTVTLSHEILELLVDPFGKLFLRGPAPNDDQSTVEYLAEICDPCQSDDCAYLVNTDQLVSDFVIPSFYSGFGSGSYSFRGRVTAPRSVLSGGYMTWRDPNTAMWSQLIDSGDGAGPQVRPVDPSLLQPDVHLRGVIDRDTDAFLARSSQTKPAAQPSVPQGKLPKRAGQPTTATISHAKWWEREINRVCKRKKSGRK